MKRDREGVWLGRQIDSAKQSLNEWPDWMKHAAHFEGSDSGSSESSENEVLNTQPAETGPKRDG